MLLWGSECLYTWKQGSSLDHLSAKQTDLLTDWRCQFCIHPLVTQPKSCTQKLLFSTRSHFTPLRRRTGDLGWGRVQFGERGGMESVSVFGGGGRGLTETPCCDLITVICMCHALKEKRKCSNQTIIGGSRQKHNRGWLTVLSLSHNIRI